MRRTHIAGILMLAAGMGLSTAQAADKPGAGPKGSLASADAKWVEKAAHGGLAEVEAGKLAAAQGKREDVRNFGKQMVEDHGKANEELKAIAERKGMTVPGKTDDKHAKAIGKLSGMTGEKFDKEYVAKAGVNDHQEAEKHFKKGSADLKDPDLKAFAQKTLPTIQHHLQMSKEMKKMRG